MISFIDLRSVRVIVTILLFAVALSFLYAARQTLMAFLFAIFFAYLMDPRFPESNGWYAAVLGPWL